MEIINHATSRTRRADLIALIERLTETVDNQTDRQKALRDTIIAIRRSTEELKERGKIISHAIKIQSTIDWLSTIYSIERNRIVETLTYVQRMMENIVNNTNIMHVELFVIQQLFGLTQ